MLAYRALLRILSGGRSSFSLQLGGELHDALALTAELVMTTDEKSADKAEDSQQRAADEDHGECLVHGILIHPDTEDRGDTGVDDGVLEAGHG